MIVNVAAAFLLAAFEKRHGITDCFYPVNEEEPEEKARKINAAETLAQQHLVRLWHLMAVPQ